VFLEVLSNFSSHSNFEFCVLIFFKTLSLGTQDLFFLSRHSYCKCIVNVFFKRLSLGMLCLPPLPCTICPHSSHVKSARPKMWQQSTKGPNCESIKTLLEFTKRNYHIHYSYMLKKKGVRMGTLIGSAEHRLL